MTSDRSSGRSPCRHSRRRAFLALVVQFRRAVKPFIVFAAIPYGMVGAIAALWIMDTPFGFMGFLGVASLVGVIVSHVIALPAYRDALWSLVMVPSCRRLIRLRQAQTCIPTQPIT